MMVVKMSDPGTTLNNNDFFIMKRHELVFVITYLFAYKCQHNIVEDLIGSNCKKVHS